LTGRTRAPLDVLMTRSRSLLGLVFSLLCAIAAASYAASFRPGEWYEALAKPAFQPPAAVFGPVWSALYAAMAVAAWRVWLRGEARGALTLYGAQLGLNAWWSQIFFGWHAIGLALIEILVLWTAILATALAFRRRDHAAGWLLVPYLAWVSFAVLLNVSIFVLNR
jgi:benzodiazapine receptor